MPDLTRITVNLLPAAHDAMRDYAIAKRISNTDAINRMLQEANFFRSRVAEGATIMLKAADGTISEVFMV